MVMISKTRMAHFDFDCENDEMMIVVLFVVMIRTPGVERDVLMMSNMRMIKVLKMIIVMAMMMPSKALGL